MSAPSTIPVPTVGAIYRRSTPRENVAHVIAVLRDYPGEDLGPVVVFRYDGTSTPIAATLAQFVAPFSEEGWAFRPSAMTGDEAWEIQRVIVAYPAPFVAGIVECDSDLTLHYDHPDQALAYDAGRAFGKGRWAE